MKAFAKGSRWNIAAAVLLLAGSLYALYMSGTCTMMYSGLVGLTDREADMLRYHQRAVAIFWIAVALGAVSVGFLIRFCMGIRRSTKIVELKLEAK